MKQSDSQTPCPECGGTGRVSNPRDILGTETCLACAGRPTPGDPFPCPNCGAEDWRVSYPESAHQDVLVVVGEDGQPEIEDYTGNTGTYSDGSGDNEELRCNECDYVITFGEHIFLTTEESARRAKITAALAKQPEGVEGVNAVRNELIRWRDKALDPATFSPGAATLLSHAIAHLMRLQEIEEAMR